MQRHLKDTQNNDGSHLKAQEEPEEISKMNSTLKQRWKFQEKLYKE